MPDLPSLHVDFDRTRSIPLTDTPAVTAANNSHIPHTPRPTHNEHDAPSLRTQNSETNAHLHSDQARTRPDTQTQPDHQ